MNDFVFITWQKKSSIYFCTNEGKMKRRFVMEASVPRALIRHLGKKHSQFTIAHIVKVAGLFLFRGDISINNDLRVFHFHSSP